MRSSLLIQQCSPCLIRLLWMVFEMGGRWLFSCCFVEFVQYISKHSCVVPVYLFLYRFSSVRVVHLYSRMDTTAAWKMRFKLSDRFYFHMTDNLSIATHTFACCILTSFSVDETLLPRYANFFTNFRKTLFHVEMCPFYLKDKYSVLSVFTLRPMPLVACSWLCSRDFVWIDVFSTCTKSFA